MSEPLRRGRDLAAVAAAVSLVIGCSDKVPEVRVVPVASCANQTTSKVLGEGDQVEVSLGSNGRGLGAVMVRFSHQIINLKGPQHGTTSIILPDYGIAFASQQELSWLLGGASGDSSQAQLENGGQMVGISARLEDSSSATVNFDWDCIVRR